MEFLPGAFEREWERRRATLLHEMQLRQVEKIDWDEPRRGGVAALPDKRLGGLGRARPRRSHWWRGGWARGGSAAGRSMRTRFTALAHGSQPAMVKLASYGGGARAGDMMSYTSRGGALAVENDRGERVVGKAALAKERAEWEHLFDNRASSRDLGVFHVTIESGSIARAVDRDEQIRDVLRSGFRDRRYVYTVHERNHDELDVSGVVVLRNLGGERLTGDRKAAGFVQQRYDESRVGQGVEARFRFHGYGNGVGWGTARVRELVERAGGEVRDESGRRIEGAEQAGDLVQKEWRKELHSRKGRDVMHLIVSARAGTGASAFEGAVRNFLGDQFVGHRYIFAIHDPALDPKEITEGGKRPHIHAHAIVTMRSEMGARIETSPRVFREWRSLIAKRAREHGIDMELTDRRELASAPAYTRHQVRPVSYRGRTKHEGTTQAAHARYRAKRSNELSLAGSDRSKEYAAKAAGVWNELASEKTEARVSAFAAAQNYRLETAARNSQIDLMIAADVAYASKNNANVALFSELIEGMVDQMREMTRPEFEAYEKRVETVLASIEQTLEASDRADFDDVAAAAREVVDIRRAYLELSQRQIGAEPGQVLHDRWNERRDDVNAQWDLAVARFGAEAVESANEVLVQVGHYRDGLDRIEAGELPRSYAASYRAGLVREVLRAAELAVNDDNRYMRDVARTDQDLQRAIERVELSRREHGSAVPQEREHQVSDPTGLRIGGQNENAAGGMPDRPEAERNREQQHAPNLREIEQAIEERQERGRDERER
ncbi:hypothetical protein [Mesorhizobium sp. WSM2239]|uniref:MobA/VirD2-like nuclease domain-containing protein n=2 Tax=unclassified Mesorhizobium TaxID=325217 RepID=A0AAU8DIJ1_9HYPH